MSLRADVPACSGTVYVQLVRLNGVGLNRGKGRLELTWANKDMRLLAHDDISYEWVDPADWRVAEVRLLHEVGLVGDPPRIGNWLIQGDALHALTALSSIPSVKGKILGKVKLCYIDPPFNTGQTFQHFDDAVEHSVWLTMLRDRLVQIHTLLSQDGSVWVHLDDAEVHRARCVLDEVFGPENFVATITWEKSDSPRNSARFLSVDCDYIHVYAKDAERWRPNRLERTAEVNEKYRNPDADPRGPWFGDNLRANKPYSLGLYEVTGPTGKSFSAPPGKYWRISKDKFDEMNADGRIWWGNKGDAFPTMKRFLSDVGLMVPRTLWSHAEVGSNRTSSNEIKRLFPTGAPFATPKPEGLMERIIQIASNKADIVLDCFAGSGTTAAVAQKMGRRWITVELIVENMNRFVRPRLDMVVYGKDSGGITSSVAWQGGSGYCEFVVGPSMFESVESTVVLADWATGGELAEAVAAQLGYALELEAPFAGRKGRSRLAVLDGMLTVGVGDHLLARLGEKETLMVVAQALEPGVEEHVRLKRPGSRARKVPRDLAHMGRRPSRLVRLDDANDEVAL